MDVIYTNSQIPSCLLLEGKVVFPTYPILFLIVVFLASSILLVFCALAMFYANGDSNLFRQVAPDAQQKALIIISVLDE